MGHHWTKQEARQASEKGLVTRRKKMSGHPEAYRRGYQTGWAACERFYRRMRQAQKRTAA